MITWSAEKTQKALAGTAAAALDKAREDCPVRTGRLKNSIKGVIAGNAAVISANTDYAAFVEFGSGRSAPRPFMQNALSAAAEKAPEIFLKDLFGAERSADDRY